MTKHIPIGVACVAAVLVCAGCATTERAWTTASQQNTTSAYEVFLQKHPDASEAAEARLRIDRLNQEDAWRRASNQNTMDAYGSFVAQYPQSDHASVATSRIQRMRQERDYEAVSKTATIEAFESFLKQYPTSPHSSAIKSQLDPLYLKRDWDSALRANSVAAYELFLQKHPSCTQAKDALAAIENLDWGSAEAAGLPDALLAFIKKYPKSANTDKARSALWNITTPDLVKAAASNDFERVKTLVHKGSDVNTNCNQGVTALMYASYQGNLEMVKFLVEKGADINHVSGTESAIYLSDVGNYFTDSKKTHSAIVEYLTSRALGEGVQPSLMEIRACVRDIVTEAKSNFGGVGIAIVTISRDNGKNAIELTGKVASWSGSVAMYYIGTWRFSLVRDGEKWRGTGKLISQD